MPPNFLVPHRFPSQNCGPQPAFHRDQVLQEDAVYPFSTSGHASPLFSEGYKFLAGSAKVSPHVVTQINKILQINYIYYYDFIFYYVFYCNSLSLLACTPDLAIFGRLCKELISIRWQALSLFSICDQPQFLVGCAKISISIQEEDQVPSRSWPTTRTFRDPPHKRVRCPKKLRTNIYLIPRLSASMKYQAKTMFSGYRCLSFYSQMLQAI